MGSPPANERVIDRIDSCVRSTGRRSAGPRLGTGGIDKQCEQVWKNIGQVLKAGGMGYKDIVKITTFLTDSRFVVPNRAARLGTTKRASVRKLVILTMSL